MPRARTVVTRRRKGFSRLEIRRIADSALAADGGHRPRGLSEALLADVVLELFAPDRSPDEPLELLVGDPLAQWLAQVGLVEREKACAQLALGSQPHTVAVRAERLRDRV